ncbi:MAG TPA: hypothetical protein VHY21_04385 [Pseudonocardiaceae bacterium]|nr:hypothetical protein [Pseudonocardiaceae bacterium]
MTDCRTDDTTAHLTAHQVPVELRPVQRAGAEGAMTSIHVRDPDGNLAEISSYTR